MSPRKEPKTSVLWQALTSDLPRLGRPGSRSSRLHIESPLVTAISGDDLASQDTYRGLTALDKLRFAALRWLGTCGSLLLGFAALGAGALPVVGNPYNDLPGGKILSQLLPAASVLAFIGIGLVVLAWVLMAPLVGSALPGQRARRGSVSTGMLWRTAVAWILPLLITAPLFTQDIYSYLAQGSITRQGLDPYSAGPIDLLGVDHHLARSVPFIWAHSPSPYGPVALGIAALVSEISQDSIVIGVLLHRLFGVAGLAIGGWALIKLSRRCGVNPAAAVWLGMLNPLTVLHLVGGIHNESLMVGLMLLGLELTFRGHDRLDRLDKVDFGVLAFWLGAGGIMAGAGMVKVSAFLAIAFTGAAIARDLYWRWQSHWKALGAAMLIEFSALVGSIILVSLSTGIGTGWITGQGGAAQIRSWMSITTDIGVIFGWLGMLLDLGDHTDAMLVFTRAAGLILAGLWTSRMLWAAYCAQIAAVGGLGVSMFVVVLLFPVVHPWYFLWAIVPLSAWANRPFFRTSVVSYSAFISLILLPRGLSLPPSTVANIYITAALAFVVVVFIGWWGLRKWGVNTLD
ncbi:polyprenol phosphomannose-dependent alpha 1,6 mannosyltransferase MptB [Corynebacterium caspium]|uniref:polyprenol phosphomannose-dependent alpha 1,6 mannosyltransferase MptB n=1 Tax=Corynebacterium caspium TaxID=234828 RepID=UPI00036E7C8D|nr:polyprenol phosphomannose-dependent alpha 1,6 mannosyltransferase MptB [Corynebacterium caspium]WKD59263.1 hypothetical protein CCASP_04330 [Corynebacterium caspium DSM 44850]